MGALRCLETNDQLAPSKGGYTVMSLTSVGNQIDLLISFYLSGKLGREWRRCATGGLVRSMDWSYAIHGPTTTRVERLQLVRAAAGGCIETNRVWITARMKHFSCRHDAAATTFNILRRTTAVDARFESP
ncbi:hypothetical protein KIN20_031919 [Parelaphostrongylus tenuis]|uniref:Uncharacterized protein n=1 Tax=Parelaphostrongylus tenuis TaxID=148309 RepID=A0AAD5R668_PARTN|nr:hypothetical protein KIN20_031919 [Parelaphostrongylus tenuis]